MKVYPILPLVLTALLSACVNLKPKPDDTRVYTLAAEVPSAFETKGMPECYIDRVELPGYLEGTRIHYRAGGGLLDSVSGARWAEAPLEALPRAIAMHLQATGKVRVLGHYPWPKTAAEAATVSVRFDRFSANSNGRVELIARWQIELPDAPNKEGHYIASDLHWDGSDVSDYVARLDVGLAGLAEEIAQELK